MMEEVLRCTRLALAALREAKQEAIRTSLPTNTIDKLELAIEATVRAMHLLPEKEE